MYRRIPKLAQRRFQVDLSDIKCFPMLIPIVHKIGKRMLLTKQHCPDKDGFLEVLVSLTVEEIVWRPYEGIILPDPYEAYKILGRSITTAICDEFAANHMPYQWPMQHFEGVQHQEVFTTESQAGSGQSLLEVDNGG
ncbi:unnamed protein product [Cuscuta epithymum]|uniref:Uncharacterized protein n=1 Tax=Cuscuta epithymum TaxID=186058 RepID=A0AAV0E2F6_9ASTE|nr:unnamed protein product [Cuscuta epithymum]